MSSDLRLCLIARPAGGSPAQIAQGVAAAISDVDADVSLTLRPMDVQVRATFNTERVLALLAGVFAGLALLLVAVGLYGVISHGVTRRRMEIGLRIALGAARGAVVRLVLARVTMTVACGVVIGGVASLWATKFIESLLVNVPARNPGTLGMAVLALISVAAAASWLPTRRAARLDPARVLREE